MGVEGFEDWLRDEPLPEPREGFREELRARFLAEGQKSRREAQESGSRRSDGPRREDVSIDLEQHLRDHPSVPQAREAFRSSLRERFLDVQEGTSGRSFRTRQAAAPRGKLLRFAPAAGLAAAAAVLFFLLPRFERAPLPTWQVASSTGAVVRVSGEPMDPGGTRFRERLARALVERDGSNAELSVDDGKLRLVYGDQLRMDIQPGSTVAFTAGAPALQLDQGEVYIKTFDAYPGRGLSIETPDSAVAVHGTTLGVLVAPSGTCVCVAEGEVDFVRVRRGVASVHEEHKHFMFRDPDLQDVIMGFPDLSDPNLDEAEREHSQGLLDFHQEAP